MSGDPANSTWADMPSHQFYIGDYLVFSITIIVSLGIGVFYAVTGRNNASTSEYLVGGRSMSYIPTTISLLVSFESAIMMLGQPAETYTHGFQFIWWSVGTFVSQLLCVMIVVPLLHPLKITSCYEYLELRFNSRAVRLVGTTLGIISQSVYSGVVLYGPAVAIEAVTGFPLLGSIAIVAGASIIYTSIGGIKAVIWTDVFQAVIMLTGILSILIKCTLDAGGAKRVVDIAVDGGRMDLWNFSIDPRTRHTFWNLFVGSIVRGFGLGFNQSTVQRISSTRSVGDAKKMLLLVAPCFLLTMSMAGYEGIVTYAYYQTKGCDPIASKQIKNPNQILPYVVMDTFANTPGMPGLFLASLCSGSLSTLSSALSSLAAQTWTDLLKPLLGDIKESKATIIIKFTVLVYGILGCGIALIVSQIGGPLTQIANSLVSAFTAPLSGVFFLACFFPKVNAKSCMIGAFLMTILCCWISLGINFSPKARKTASLPPASTENCLRVPINVTLYGDSNSNFTMAENMTRYSPEATTAPPVDPWTVNYGFDEIYSISYQWISGIGIFGTILIGWICSLITGQNEPGDVDPRYLICATDTLLIFLPSSLKKAIRSIGPQFMDDKHRAKFADLAKNKEPTKDTELDTIPEKSGLSSVSTITTNGDTVDSTKVENSDSNHNGNGVAVTSGQLDHNTRF